jgi:hypothetical protein
MDKSALDVGQAGTDTLAVLKGLSGRLKNLSPTGYGALGGAAMGGLGGYLTAPEESSTLSTLGRILLSSALGGGIGAAGVPLGEHFSRTAGESAKPDIPSSIGVEGIPSQIKVEGVDDLAKALEPIKRLIESNKGRNVWRWQNEG